MIMSNSIEDDFILKYCEDYLYLHPTKVCACMRLFIRKYLWVCLLMAVSLPLRAQWDDGLSIHALRAWTSPDDQQLHLEIDVQAGELYSSSPTKVDVMLQTGDLNNPDVLLKKKFRIHPTDSLQTFTFSTKLPQHLSRWCPENPTSCYNLVTRVRGEDLGTDVVLAIASIDFGLPDTTVDVTGMKVVYEDNLFGGFNGELTQWETDLRARRIRSQGYQVVRDGQYPSHPRMSHNCTRLGMYHEPVLPAYTAQTETERDQYLKRVEMSVKQRANSPSILQWLLPAMPDSVAMLCRKKIGEIDARPVRMWSDAQSVPADASLPHPCLSPASIAEDTIVEVAIASILKGVPSMEYPYRLNCGGGEVTDSNGQVWAADTMQSNLPGYLNAPIRVSMGGEMKLLADADLPIVQSYRICTSANQMAYRFEVDSLSSYCLELFMQEPSDIKRNQRLFALNINGEESSPIDVVALSGGRHTVIKVAFSIVTQDKDYIEVKFSKPFVGYGIVSAIAIGKLR